MGNSESHHYVPVFLLKNWCTGRERKMWWYRRTAEGKVTEKRIAPRSTSYEIDLNMLKQAPFSGVTESQIRLTEDKLSEIDDRSSRICKKLVTSGISSLSGREKAIWLNFVLLLSERTPERLAEIDRVGLQLLDHIIDEAISKWGNSETWRKTAEILRNSAFTYNHARIRLHDIAKSIETPIRSDLFEWRLVDFSSSPMELFTSNFPVVSDIHDRHSMASGFIEMALSPKRLCICAPTGFEYDTEVIRLLAISYNVRLLSLRPSYVYSLNPIRDNQFAKYRKALDIYLA